MSVADSDEIFRIKWFLKYVAISIPAIRQQILNKTIASRHDLVGYFVSFDECSTMHATMSRQWCRR